MKAGADVRHVAARQRGACGIGRRRFPGNRRAGPLAHQPQHGGLQSAEAEIHTPRRIRRQESGGCGLIRSVAIRVRQTSDRECVGIVTTFTREAIDGRSARIAQPKQFGHLVVRFARGIVTRPPDELIRPGRGDVIEARMPSRHDEDRRRQRQLTVRERQRLDVTGQVVHGHDRKIPGPAQCLCEGNADEE